MSTDGPYCKYSSLGAGVRTVVILISTKGGENEYLTLVFGCTYELSLKNTDLKKYLTVNKLQSMEGVL